MLGTLNNTIVMKNILLLFSFFFVQNSFFAQDKIITTSSNLKYKIVKPTNGIKPLITDRVSVHLKIILSDGTVNYDTYKIEQPFEALPTQMIKGMTEGVLLMPLGSKFTFYVPSELAYGKAGIGTAIKPNENLVCEVELLKINGVGVPASPVTENKGSDFIKFRNVAYKYFDKKDYQQALTFSEKALALQKNDTVSLQIRGISKQNLNDLDGALADFTTIINMIGDKAQGIFYRRGDIYETKKEYKLATADYKKMLQLKPDFTDAQKSIDRVFNKELGQMMDGQNEKLTQFMNSQDPNRPFMQLIRSTTQELEKILKTTTDKRILLDAFNKRANFYQFLMKRSKELEAFNDLKWPIFKAEYKKLLVNFGIKEEELKDF